MATGKEEAQAERLATNAENQRRQDEFGLAIARAEAAVRDEDGTGLAEETRSLHMDALAADQKGQSDENGKSGVSAAASDEKDAYVEHNVVVKGRPSVDGVRAPEDAAYEDAAFYDVGEEVELSDDVEAELAEADEPEDAAKVAEDNEAIKNDE